MGHIAIYRPPRGWLRVGKYLLPVGGGAQSWWPTAAPLVQVPAEQLARQHPECVNYQSVAEAETVEEFAFVCRSGGSRQVRSLASQTFPPAFVARLKRGMSFGRHCCVIGPERKAVRETGYYLDGQVQAGHVPVSQLRFRHWRKRWAGTSTSRLCLPPRQRIDGRVAVLNARYSHNYFHWLIEVLPRIVPLRRAGVWADYFLVDCLSPFQQDVLAALGIERRQLIQPHCRMLLEADELIVPSFPSPDCLREFGRLLLGGFGADRAIAASRRVFISRRKTGTRTLANERQIEDYLRGRGFETHAMEDYPLAKQARLVREAAIIVATHGAGLANLIFARPGARVIEIVPEGRFNYACYPKRARFFGLNHQIVFAQRLGHKAGLNVSLDDVAAALAEAETATGHAAA